MKGVQYKKHFLAKGSDAIAIFESAKKDPEMLKMLDRHLKDVDQRAKDLLTRYDKPKIV